MLGLRELRRKIKSVRSTQQITKAMKMVAAARLRRAQSQILDARPFAVKMEETVRHLAELEVASDILAGREVQIHPLFDVREGASVGLVLITSDKGLCGAFNANLLREAVRWLREHRGFRIHASAVGRKGRDFLHRLKDFDLRFVSEMAGIFPKAGFVHAELLGKAVLEAYEKERLARVDVIYNEFKSVASQRVVRKQLLPLETPPSPSSPHPTLPPQGRGESYGFHFEPRREVLLEALLPRHVKAQLYRVLLESQAAELAARMNAMDAASENAGELLAAFNLKLNQTRQATITREIAELVGGAEALAS